MPNFTTIPERMRGGLKRYVEDGIMPGSFLTAVLENNLIESIRFADDENIHLLYEYGDILTNEIPFMCWGSPARIQAWCERKRREREEK